MKTTTIARVVSGALVLGCGPLAAGTLDRAFWCLQHRQAAGFAELVSTCAATVVAGVGAWLCCGVALALLTRLPGVGTSAWGRLALAFTPGCCRRLVALACGVAAVVTSAPALAAPTRLDDGPGRHGHTGSTTALPVPDRPVAARPKADRRVSDRAERARAPARPTPGTAGWVRVRPGDSLWSIAADHLTGQNTGQDAGPNTGEPTNARVSASWPRWFAANRDRIGDDPALIQPGLRLRIPPPPPGRNRR